MLITIEVSALQYDKLQHEIWLFVCAVCIRYFRGLHQEFIPNSLERSGLLLVFLSKLVSELTYDINTQSHEWHTKNTYKISATKILSKLMGFSGASFNRCQSMLLFYARIYSPFGLTIRWALASSKLCISFSQRAHRSNWPIRSTFKMWNLFSGKCNEMRADF